MALRVLYLQQGLSVNPSGGLIGKQVFAQLSKLGEESLRAHVVFEDEIVKKQEDLEIAKDMLALSYFSEFKPDIIYMEGGPFFAKGSWRIPLEALELSVIDGAILIIADSNAVELAEKKIFYRESELLLRACPDYGIHDLDPPVAGRDSEHFWKNSRQIICYPEKMVISDWLRPVYEGIEHITVGGPASLKIWADTLASGNRTSTAVMIHDEPMHMGAACPFASVRELGIGYVVWIAGSVSSDAWLQSSPDNTRWLCQIASFLTDTVQRKRSLVRQTKQKNSPIVTGSKWRDVYLRYRALERRWHLKPMTPEQAHSVFLRCVQSRLEPEDLASEMRLDHLPIIGPELWDEAMIIRAEIAKIEGGHHFDDPLEDVYEAALSIIPFGAWDPAPDYSQTYRGQRKAIWEVIPSLFREYPTKRMVEHETDRVFRLVKALQKVRKDLSDEQAVALVQHYAAELKAQTWLLDFTWDPLVALHFASLGGEDGDIGVVWCLSSKEWNLYSAGGKNRLGDVRIIEVPGVPRIAAQRALFLDTSHPDLFEQYVPFARWFCQKEGLTFEDPDASVPVTCESIYPKVDEILDMVRSLPVLKETEALTVGPRGDACIPLDAGEYLAITESWCEREHWVLDKFSRRTLKAVCEFHARIQRMRKEIDITLRSLQRLYEAVKRIVMAQDEGYCTLEEALYWTFSRLPAESTQLTILKDITYEVAAAQ